MCVRVCVYAGMRVWVALGEAGAAFNHAKHFVLHFLFKKCFINKV